MPRVLGSRLEIVAASLCTPSDLEVLHLQLCFELSEVERNVVLDLDQGCHPITLCAAVRGAFAQFSRFNESIVANGPFPVPFHFPKTPNLQLLARMAPIAAALGACPVSGCAEETRRSG